MDNPLMRISAGLIEKKWRAQGLLLEGDRLQISGSTLIDIQADPPPARPRRMVSIVRAPRFLALNISHQYLLADWCHIDRLRADGDVLVIRAARPVFAARLQPIESSSELAETLRSDRARHVAGMSEEDQDHCALHDGVLFHDLGREDEAKASWLRARAHGAEQQPIMASFLLGVQAGERGEPADALGYFDEVVASGTALTDRALTMGAAALAELGRTDEALARAGRVTGSADPVVRQTSVRLSVKLLVRQRRYQDAHALIEPLRASSDPGIRELADELLPLLETELRTSW